MDRKLMRNLLIMSVGILTFVSTQVYFNQQASREQRAREELERRERPTKLAALLASQASEGAPRMLNEEVRLDSAEAGPEARFVTRYTLVSISRSEMARAQLSTMRQNAVIQLCDSDARTRKVLAEGVTFQFDYRGKDGLPITSLSVTNADCLNPSARKQSPQDMLY